MSTIQTAAAIAAHMSEKWEAAPGGWSNDEDAYLNGPNGERVHMTVSPYHAKGRVVFTGTLDQELFQHRAYNETQPSITASPTKTPERMARDIERRLLPDYRTLLSLVIGRKTDADEHERARKELSAQIAAALGDGLWTRDERRHGQPDKKLYVGRYEDRIHGEVEVSSANYDVHFDFRVAPAQAVKLAEAIAAIRGEGK